MPDIDFARNPRLLHFACALSFVAIILQLCFRPTHAPLKGMTKTPQIRQRSMMRGMIIIVAFALVSTCLYASSNNALALRRASCPDFPRLPELSISLLSFSFLTIGRIITIPNGCLIARTITSGSATEQQQQRFAAQLWKSLYHTGATLAPLFILRTGASWWPPGLGRPEGTSRTILLFQSTLH